MKPELEMSLECLVFRDETDDEDYLQLATDVGYAKAYLQINELLEHKHALSGEDIHYIIDHVEAQPEWFGKVLASELSNLMMIHVNKRKAIDAESIEELDKLLDAYILIGNLFGTHTS